MTCHVITCLFANTESTVVLVIIFCHEMTVCAFFIGLLWWLIETGGCSLQMATYQSGIIVMTDQPMTDIKPSLWCFYVTLLKIQKFFIPCWSLKPFIWFHLACFFFFSSFSRFWCGHDSLNLISKMQCEHCIYENLTRMKPVNAKNE